MEILTGVLAAIIATMTTQKMTQKDLCEKIGISQNAFTNWKNGNNKSYIKHLPEIADALDVSVDYLLGKEENKVESDKVGLKVVPMEEQAMRPIIGMASAGSGVLAQEQILGWESVDIKYNTNEYFYLQISGDSMAPKIDDGDLVLVHRQDEVSSGDVAVVLVTDHDEEAEGFVKKVEIDGDSVTLVSFNPYYPPRVFSGKSIQQLSFVGKVVELKRKF